MNNEKMIQLLSMFKDRTTVLDLIKLIQNGDINIIDMLANLEDEK